MDLHLKRTRAMVLVGVVAATLGLGREAVRGAIQYKVVNLGAISGQGDTFATSINTTGNVAVSSQDAGSTVHPGIYTGGSGFTAITSYAGKGDTIQQLNDTGLAVGYSTDSSGSNTVAVYSNTTVAHPALTLLSPLMTGGQSEALGVSPTGAFGSATIVGESLNGTGNYAAVKWTGSGTPSALTPADTADWDPTGPSKATAINSSGVIAGQAQSLVSSQPDAFVTLSNGNFKDIAPGGSTQSQAEGINVHGVVVGSWVDGSTNQFGFVYNPTTGTTTSLGVLGTPMDGSGDSLAYSSDAESINMYGQIVGESLTTSDVEDAVIYNPAGTPTDLNGLIDPSLGWSLSNAYSINDSGDIVGTGTLGGNVEAFELVPVSAVPEPTTLGLLSLAAVTLLGRRRRRYLSLRA